MTRLLFILMIFLPILSFGQKSKDTTSKIDISMVKYNVDTTNNFKGFEKAKLILDYYYTEGISHLDRYSYEIVLIDSMLMLVFDSPQTDDFNNVLYKKKQLLSSSQVDSIKKVLVSAKLTQLKKGIPDPSASANTQEVLIAKFKDKNIDISGGMFNYVAFENSMTEKDIKNEIAKERKITSSIGGDYDRVFKTMKKYFTDLDKLIKQARVR